MLIKCPQCGQSIKVKHLGRKPLNIPLKNVCEALEKYCNTAFAARKLGCSQSYIYKTLKANGLKLNDFVDG
jgi:hypothetical protein